MNDEKHIIMPGDPDWDKQPSLDQEYYSEPKLPNEILEAAFTEVINDVQNMIAEGGPIVEHSDNLPVAEGNVATEVEKNTPAPPNPYRYHRPAQKKSFEIPLGEKKELDAVLLEDLPRKWERICFTHFRKDDHITLTGITFFPGIGAMYEFEEGKRGSYCVRTDQVSFEMPTMAEPPVLDVSPSEGSQDSSSILPTTGEVNNATLDGQDTKI